MKPSASRPALAAPPAKLAGPAILILIMFALTITAESTAVVHVPQPVKFFALLEHTLPVSQPPPPSELAAAHVTTVRGGVCCFRGGQSAIESPAASVTTLEMEFDAEQIRQSDTAEKSGWRKQVLPRVCAWVASAMDLKHAVDCEDGERRTQAGTRVRISSAVISTNEHMSTARGQHSNPSQYLIRVALQLPSALTHDLRLSSLRESRTFDPLATCFSLTSWRANNPSRTSAVIHGTSDPFPPDNDYAFTSPAVHEFYFDTPTPSSPPQARIQLHPDPKGPSLHPTPTLLIAIPASSTPICSSSSSQTLVIQSWLPPGLFMDPYQIALRPPAHSAHWSIYSSARLPDLENPLESQFAVPHLIVAKVDLSAPSNVAPGGGIEYMLPVPLHARYQRAVEMGADAEVNVGPFVVACQGMGDGFMMPGNEREVVGVSNVVGVKVPRAKDEDREWVVRVTSAVVVGGVVAVVVAVWVWGPRRGVGAGVREKVE